jgi:hypothetical protein
VADGANKNDHPRSRTVKAAIEHYSRERERLYQENGINRGLDTAIEFSTLPEMNRSVDVSFTTQTSVSIRTRMDLLLGQYMLLRSEGRRRVYLPEVFTVDALREAPGGNGVPMLGLRLNRGKVPTYIQIIKQSRSLMVDKSNW